MLASSFNITSKMQIIKFKDAEPQIDKDAYISPGVSIIGDVRIGKGSSVWFGSVLRGDVAPITIGENSNIQDGTIIHTSRFNGSTEIGHNVTIGHRAVIHACQLMDHAFIGMGAIVMDKAIIEPFALVAAGALVTNGKIVKTGQLWAGSPARYVRDLNEAELAHIKESAKNYAELAEEYLKR